MGHPVYTLSIASRYILIPHLFLCLLNLRSLSLSLSSCGKYRFFRRWNFLAVRELHDAGHGSHAINLYPATGERVTRGNSSLLKRMHHSATAPREIWAKRRAVPSIFPPYYIFVFFLLCSIFSPLSSSSAVLLPFPRFLSRGAGFFTVRPN